MSEISIKNYIDAIDYVRNKHFEVMEQKKKYKQEIDEFISLVEHCGDISENLGKQYIGQETSVNRKRADFLNIAKNLRIFELSEFISNKIKSCEKVINDLNGVYRSDEESDKQLQTVEYFCTFVYVIYTTLLANDAYKNFCAKHIAECNTQVTEKYEQCLKMVNEYTIEHINKVAVDVQPLSTQITMPDEFPSSAYIAIGKYDQTYGDKVLKVKENVYEDTRFKKLIFDIASANRSTDAFGISFSPTSKQGSILIHQPKYSINESGTALDKGDTTLNELIETLICRYLSVFPRITKRFGVIQKRTLSELDAFSELIIKRCKEFGIEGENNGHADYALGKNIDVSLRQILIDCVPLATLLNSNGGGLFEYNRNSYKQGVWKQMTLLVVKDYPVGFDDKSIEYLEKILQNADKFGITVIMTVCDDVLAELRNRRTNIDYESIFNRDYFYKNNIFDISDYSLISRYTYEKVDFGDCSLKLDAFDKSSFLENLELCLSSHRDPAIPLQSLIYGGFDSPNFPDERRRREFSKKLTFPIGRAGTDSCSLELYQSGGPSPHVVIAGTTGTGKSVLLQDIILSAMCHYTPDELELYLFDFKQTPEGFEQYSSGFPHVKKIAVQCKERDIFELLTMVKNKYEQRIHLLDGIVFQGKPVSNISQYNAYARTNRIRPIPRVLVVIDEYQTITSEKCLLLLQEIAQKGRAYGVVLIMASQSNNVPSFGNIVKQFGNRFEFKNEQPGNLISGMLRRINELNGPKGLCFFSNDGSAAIPVLVRCGYIDNENSDDMQQFSDYIKKKYGSNYVSNTYKVGGVEAIFRQPAFDNKNNKFLNLADYVSEFGNKPEEVIFDDEIESEVEWLTFAKEKFINVENDKDRGFILRVGLNSISLAPVEYTLDRQTPYLLLCGDAQRIKSIEFSIAKSALLGADGRNINENVPTVYYVDGERTDKKKYAVYMLEDRLDGIDFISPDSASVGHFINGLYDEYKRRKATVTSKYSPIIVIISEFEHFTNLLSGNSDISGGIVDVSVKGNQAEIDAKEKLVADIDNGGKGIRRNENSTDIKSKDKELSTLKKFLELLSASATNMDIFFSIHISGISKSKILYDAIDTTKLTSIICTFKRASGGSAREEFARDEAIARLGGFSKAFIRERNERIKSADINVRYSYKLSNDRTDEFIPYEYKKQE